MCTKTVRPQVAETLSATIRPVAPLIEQLRWLSSERSERIETKAHQNQAHELLRFEKASCGGFDTGLTALLNRQHSRYNT